MARVKITLPDDTLYSHEYLVSIGDINYGGHVGNERFLLFAQDARLAWIKSLGYQSELSIEGLGFIMGDAALVYKAEAFHGDKLAIDLGLGDTSKYGFDLIARIWRHSDQQDIALVKTAILFFDYQQRSLAQPPANFLEKLN